MMRVIIIGVAGLIMIFAAGMLGSAKREETLNIDSLIKYYANHWDLEYALVKAIAKVESNLNPNAKNPSDPSYGLMQITPILAQDFGLVKDWRNPTPDEIASMMNPMTNLDIACWFLNHLSKYSFDRMVQSYNVGETGYSNGARNYTYLEKVRSYYEIYNTS